MPDLTPFIDDTLARLQAPIQAYYDAIRNADPATPRGRIIRTQAGARVSRAFTQTVRNAIDAAAVLATGGTFNGDQRTIIQEARQTQNSYAIGFMLALDKLTVDQAMARAASYLPAILHVYSDLQVYDMPELPVMPGDGQTICRAWCKCQLRIAKSGNDYDVYWQLGVAEHCEDCVQLSELWNPLRFRNGVIIDDFDYSFLGTSERKMLMKTLLAIASGKQVA
jgi:hypothetical protein